jgi:hypothetical protein
VDVSGRSRNAGNKVSDQACLSAITCRETGNSHHINFNPVGIDDTPRPLEGNADLSSFRFYRRRCIAC